MKRHFSDLAGRGQASASFPRSEKRTPMPASTAASTRPDPLPPSTPDTPDAPEAEEPGGFLGLIARLGNKIPDITMLFIGAFVVVCLISAALSLVPFGYVDPTTGQPIRVVNMLDPTQLVTLLSKAVTNFASFPPLGMVIVATLGIGIADGSGYINMGLRKMLAHTPVFLLTPMVIVAGMLSHLGPDTGYVIIIPVAAAMFHAVGKHPLAGIAASFAGIAGAFAANYTPSAIDPVIQGFTQTSAQIIDPGYAVNILCNYFYAFGATFTVIPACWFVTEKIVEPWLQRNYPVDADARGETVHAEITPRENRAFWIATGVLLLAVVGLAASLVPANSIWRGPDGSLTSPKAPIMLSIVAVIFVLTGLVGLVYGFASGRFRGSKDVSDAMADITKTLVALIVFYFFAAQFMYAFNTSKLGSLLAVSGAEFLRSLNLPPQLTILGIIIFVGLLNLLITSASAKWAILAPIFVPMLMGVGIAPELTQAAFRVSDSAVNVVTPMFAFYPLIITYCQKYVRRTGIGTLSSMMLPFTVALLITLTLTLYVFWWFNIPLGLASAYLYPRP